MGKLIKRIGLMLLMLSATIIFHTDVRAAANDYTYTLNGNEATITGYNGEDTDITIPSTLDGYKVTAIGLGVFKDNEVIIRVTIPGTVKSIGKSAFLKAKVLEEVIIEDGVETINSSAFSQCTKLTKIVIPNSVTTLDGYNSGNLIFNLNTINSLIAYVVPGSAAEEYLKNSEPDIKYYYQEEYVPTVSFTGIANKEINLNVGESTIVGKSDITISPDHLNQYYEIDYFSGSNSYVSVEEVDGGWKLTGLKAGERTIKAGISNQHIIGNTEDTLTVKVVESRKAVESVVITADGTSVHDRVINWTTVGTPKGDSNWILICEGDSIQLGASVTPSNATYTGEWIIYSGSSDVSVSNTGLVTGLKADKDVWVYYKTTSKFGEVSSTSNNKVLVSVFDKSFAKTVDSGTPTTPENPTAPSNPTTPGTPNNPTTPVTPTTPATPTKPEVKVGKITLNASKFDLQKGKTIKTLALKLNQLEGDKIASVKSSNTKVLKASLSGQTIVLKGVKANKKYVTVTVTMNSGAKATCKVRVVSSAVKTKKLTLAEKKITLSKGKTTKLVVTRNPISATDKLTYKSSNKKIATVDKNGKIKAKKKGKATITVTSASGKKTTFKVTVK